MEAFVSHVNSHLRQRQENERLKTIIARIDSYEPVVSLHIFYVKLEASFYLEMCMSSGGSRNFYVKSAGEKKGWHFRHDFSRLKTFVLFGLFWL